MLVILWMGMIFAFSAQPQAVLDFGQPAWVSKLAHGIEYAVLAWLIQRARGTQRAGWLAWLIAVLYAVTDEVHQMWVPGRTALATDVVIDSVGAALGLIISQRRG